MKHALIIGGSHGLGLEIAEQYAEKQTGERVIAVGRQIPEKVKNNIKHISLDLKIAEVVDFERIMLDNWPVSSICFSQRYRPEKDLDATDKSSSEYNVMVLATAKAIQALRNCYKPNNSKDAFTRVVVIGSTYSICIGHDQELNYHLCKSAQLALVRYYSLNTNSRFNINMISPSTYIRKGSENYWEGTEKAEIWSNLAPRRLARIDEIATEVVNLMTTSSIFSSGNNILLDGGTSHLYPDQIGHI